MIVKNDIRTRDGYNDVEGVHIVYTIAQKTSDPASSVSGRLEKEGERIGIITAERDGRMYISIDKPSDLTLSQEKSIITAVLDDMEGVFNETTE